MAWIFLLTAAVFEIGWPLGFKLSHLSDNRFAWIALAVFIHGLKRRFSLSGAKTDYY